MPASLGGPEKRQYASLEEVARAAEKVTVEGGKGGASADKTPSAIIIEIQDNGPLYQTPATFTGRDVFIRAAAGYRPLIFWEAAGKDEGDPLLSAARRQPRA